MKALDNEIRILKKLRHARIVSYYGSERKDCSFHLFMEFMAGVRACMWCGCRVLKYFSTVFACLVVCSCNFSEGNRVGA